MRISACVIVKNEENNLPRWLDSMKQIANELVVVDTGSTDNTVALAEAAGARVERFKWVNDFAAAKNFAIEKAVGDWILFLDADEYFPLYECPRVREAIRKYNRDPKIGGLLFRRVDIESETGRKLGTEAYLVRGFRNVDWLRYEGAIHESLVIPSNKGMPIAQYVKDVTIYHTGYSEKLIRGKLERNLALLKESERLGHSREADDLYMADCYYGMQDYENAIRYARKAVINRVKPIGDENRPYTIWIRSLMQAGHPSDEICGAISEAVRRFPDVADYYMLWGIHEWEIRAFASAEGHLLQGLTLYREEKSGRKKRLRVNSSENYLPAVYYILGDICALKGSGQSAAEFFAENLKLQPRDVKALMGLCRLLKGSPVEDITALFNAVYDREKDGEFLAMECAKLGMDREALYYEHCSGKRLFDDFDRCVLSGRIKAAAEYLKTSIEGLKAGKAGRMVAWEELAKTLRC